MVDGGQSYLRQSVAGIDMNILVDQKTYDLLAEAIEDKHKNTLGKVCNVARVLRDHLGITLSPVEYVTDEDYTE
jgi:hypothetical protein